MVLDIADPFAGRGSGEYPVQGFSYLLLSPTGLGDSWQLYQVQVELDNIAALLNVGGTVTYEGV